MMNKTAIRIICIIMAVLMVLSVGAVVLQVFALEAYTLTIDAAVPATGDSMADYLLPAVIAIVAAVAAVLCFVMPKIKKGGKEKDDAKSDEN